MNRGQAATQYLELHRRRAHTADRTQADAYSAQLGALKDKHEGVHELALAGTRKDLGELSTAQKRHQREMREQEGINDLKRQQLLKDLRAEDSEDAAGVQPRARTRARTRRAVKSGVLGGRAYHRAARTVTAPTRRVGSVFLQAVGVAIALSLLYLILSSKGSTAFSKLLGIFTGALSALVGPGDPVAQLTEGSLKSAQSAPRNELVAELSQAKPNVGLPIRGRSSTVPGHYRIPTLP